MKILSILMIVVAVSPAWAEGDTEKVRRKAQEKKTAAETPQRTGAAGEVGTGLGDVMASPDGLHNPNVHQGIQNLSDQAALQRIQLEEMTERGEISESDRDKILLKMALAATAGFNKASAGSTRDYSVSVPQRVSEPQTFTSSGINVSTPSEASLNMAVPGASQRTPMTAIDPVFARAEEQVVDTSQPVGQSGLVVLSAGATNQSDPTNAAALSFDESQKKSAVQDSKSNGALGGVVAVHGAGAKADDSEVGLKKSEVAKALLLARKNLKKPFSAGEKPGAERGIASLAGESAVVASDAKSPRVQGMDSDSGDVDLSTAWRSLSGGTGWVSEVNAEGEVETHFAINPMKDPKVWMMMGTLSGFVVGTIIFGVGWRFKRNKRKGMAA